MSGKPAPGGPIRRTVVDNLQRLRTQTGMSYAELTRQLRERKIAIEPLGLRRMEAGQRKIDVDELVAFADVFGVSVTALFDPNASNEYRKHCLQWLLAEAEWDTT